jgi:hypothetical protein
MRINQAGSRRSGSKWAGRASATIGALLLASLAGCMTYRASGRDTFQTSGIEEWLTATDADAVVNAMAAKGLMPATIDCRFDRAVPGQVAYVSKFTWQRAPANTRYHWEVGDPTYLASKELKSNRVGLHRIAAKIVRDPATGRKVGCSIWTN